MDQIQTIATAEQKPAIVIAEAEMKLAQTMRQFVEQYVATGSVSLIAAVGALRMVERDALETAVARIVEHRTQTAIAVPVPKIVRGNGG